MPQLPDVRVDGADWLVGGGEMGKCIRAMDWWRTPLGPIDSWPQSLRTTVSLMLASNFPISLAWGSHHIQLYNDGYWPICGAKHPTSMGQDFKECWAAPWPAIGEAFERALQGETRYLENQRMFLDRNGYLEETFFTFSFSPIRDESGGVGGLFHPVTETTAKMLSERRTQALRAVASRMGKPETTEEAFNQAAEALADYDLDLPFVLLFKWQADTNEWLRVACSGIAADSPASPGSITPAQYAKWQLDGIAQAPETRLLNDLEQTFCPLICGPYPEGAKRAIILPINPPGAAHTTGVLIAAVSPRLPLDETYRGFYDQLAAAVTAAVVYAQAYQVERERAERLAEIDRAKTQFFSNVSHEFRTPLTLMIGPLEEVLNRPALDAATREPLQLVHRNSLRLLKLVNALLDFSRLEAGRIEATYEQTDLASFTVDISSAFRSAIEKAGLELSVDCPALPDKVYVDRDMWEKIVLNLLSNAFKFTERGRITVRLRAEGTRVQLQVTDTGSGIPAAELQNIFKRFHRVENAKGRTFEGTGIGLALVQELVRLHGGEIRVESQEGAGSSFTVTVPMGTAHVPRVQPAAGATQTRISPDAFVNEALHWTSPDASAMPVQVDEHKPTVLLADDNADMREYVGRLLSPAYQVFAVADGLAALKAARQRPPDLILSDVMMPGLDGFALLRELRADPKTQTVPVVMLSARAGEESRVEGLQAGADDYLIKPFSGKELLARVAANLELARMRKTFAVRAQENAESKRLLEIERRAREEAERADRMKDEFLATLSHELRTPLTAILGWSAILSSGQRPQSQLIDGLKTIERNARAQTRIIEDLLDMSRIISGKVRLDVQQVDLSLILQSALETIRPAAEAKGTRLQGIIDPLAGSIRGDPDRLQQVFWNLLSNAVKFTPRGGRVQLLLERVRSHLEVSVSDSGAGINPQFLPHVFDRLRQSDASTTRQHGGLGLGLAIAKQLIELHGGTVRAESPGIDQGATFTVLLPIMAVQEIEVPLPRHHPTVANLPLKAFPRADIAGLMILVVDDEPDARMLIRALLEDCKAHVMVAESAAEALKLLRENHPDVLISDIGMPGEDGYDLIRQVRQLERREGGATPAVALTAYARAEDRMMAAMAGFQHHVTKPVEPNELITMIASLTHASPMRSQ